MLFGADPETFAVYLKNNIPYVISPALMERDLNLQQIDGDIKHPVYIKTKEYSWMMDGVAWELTLLRPHESLVNVWKVIRESLNHLEDFISKFNHPELGELSVHTKPLVNIEPELYVPYLESSEKIYQGFIFGCDPDLDAVQLNYECKTVDVATHKYRYGGGHEHFSGVKGFEENPRPSIQILATTVGNFCTANSLFPEMDRERVSTYGRPGRYRIQHYKNGEVGIEYRTPSNCWVNFPVDKIEEMEFLARKAAEYVENPEVGIKIIEEFLEPSCMAIVNVDQKAAKDILNSLP